jgi:hypothetical protein
VDAQKFMERFGGEKFDPIERGRGTDWARWKKSLASASLHAATKGATIQHPGWGGADIGFLPFPTDRPRTRLG